MPGGPQSAKSVCGPRRVLQFLNYVVIFSLEQKGNIVYFYVMTAEEENLYKAFSPHARFEIPSEREGLEYRHFLTQLLTEMLEAADDRNKYPRTIENEESGQESGVGDVYIKKFYFEGCKLFWYDGLPGRTPPTWQKGILFRDHRDKGNYTVRSIFLLADAFAEFLATKGIPFRLFVEKRDSREEIGRARFPNK